MSRIQREIVFTADDSSFSSTVENMGQKAGDALQSIEESGKDLFKDMLEDSEKYSRSVKDRMDYLREEIKLIKEAAKIDQERAQLQEDMRYSAEKSRSPLYDHPRLERIHRENMQQIQMEGRVDNMQARVAGEEFRDWERGQDVDEGGGRRGSGRFGRILGGAGRFAGGVGTAIAAGAGFGAFMSIGNFITSAFGAARTLGASQAQVGGLNTFGNWAGQIQGMSTAESLLYQRNAAIAAGTSRGVGGMAAGQYGFEREFGMDVGGLSNLSAMTRIEGGERRTAAAAAREMLGIMKKSKLFEIEKGDFAQLGEKIGFLTDLTAMQGDMLNRVNITTSSQVIRAFGQAGFGDQRMMGVVNPMHQSIMNPQDSFSTAIIYRALRQQNPNASLLQLQKIQQQGVFGAGSVSAIMSQLKRTYSGDMLTRGVASLFNLPLDKAEELANADVDWSMIGASEGGGANVKGRGGDPSALTITAKVQDILANVGMKGYNKLDQYAEAYQTGGIGAVIKLLGQDIWAAIKWLGGEIRSIFDDWNPFAPSKSNLDFVGDPSSDEQMVSGSSIKGIFGGGSSRNRIGIVRTSANMKRKISDKEWSALGVPREGRDLSFQYDMGSGKSESTYFSGLSEEFLKELSPRQQLALSIYARKQSKGTGSTRYYGFKSEHEAIKYLQNYNPDEIEAIKAMGAGLDAKVDRLTKKEMETIRMLLENNIKNAKDNKESNTTRN